jgi:hypothetical protein
MANKKKKKCGTLPLLHSLHLDKILFPKVAGGRERYMAYSKAQAAERTKLGVDTQRKDFFYYLLRAKDHETGEGFGMAELWGESNLLIIAGVHLLSRSKVEIFTNKYNQAPTQHLPHSLQQFSTFSITLPPFKPSQTLSAPASPQSPLSTTPTPSWLTALISELALTKPCVSPLQLVVLFRERSFRAA